MEKRTMNGMRRNDAQPERYSLTPKFLLFFVATFICIASFAQYNGTPAPTYQLSLIHIYMKDFDQSMKQLDVQMKNLDKQLEKINYEKISDETAEAMKKIDWSKMNEQIEKSMLEAKEQLAKVDYAKIVQQAADAVKNIDWEKMQGNIETSMKQAQDEIAKVNTQEIQEKIKEAQEKINSKEFKEEMKADVDKAMQEAKISIEKAKVEMQNWKDFSGALQNDGLIDTSKAYTIQLKDGVLFIDGKEQSKETTDKYKKYYQGRKNFTVNMKGENDEINDDDNDKQ